MRKGAQARWGGRAFRAPAPGARRGALSTAPATRRIPSPPAPPRLAPALPRVHLWASNSHGRPDPICSRLSTPDLQRSPSSRPPDLLEFTPKARTRVGGEGSTSSQPPIIVHRHPQAEDQMGPQAAGARSPPEIHSQVLSRVARDPLAALCGIFPRDPLPSLGRQISWLPNQDSPSPQTRSPGRSIRFPRLPQPTLPTFLPRPQPSRNLAAIVGRRFPRPLAGREQGTNNQPSPPAAAAQPTQEPPPLPARAAPPPARSPRHLPSPLAARRSLPCWGRGIGWGSALSPWKLRLEAPARRAPGRSAEGPTCASLQALGSGEGPVGQRS